MAHAPASRPTGARIRTLDPGISADPAVFIGQQWARFTLVNRRAGQDSAEALERRSHLDAARAQPELANGVLMAAAALLYHRERAPDRAVVFEVAQHQYGIAQVTDVHGRVHGAHQSVLREYQQRQHAKLAQVTQQLVHLQDEEALVRHRVEIAVQAVYDDDPRLVALDGFAHALGEFPRRQFRGIYLLEANKAFSHRVVQGQSERPGASLDGAAAFVECEDDGAFAPPGRRDRISHGDGRFADTRRPDQQRTRAALEPSAQQRVESGVAAGHDFPLEVPVVLRRDKPRVDLQPAAFDREVVEAALERDAAHFHDAQAAALRAIVNRQLLQKHDAMGDRVELEVVLARREVVQQDHGGLPSGEKVLQREDLAAITQRALRQQPQFREAVNHDAGGVHLFDLVEDELAGLAQLHLGRLQYRQFLAGIERGFGRHELEDGHPRERPAVALGDQLQFAFGLRKGDVQRALSKARALEQELQGQCGLAGSGPPFVEIHPLGVEPAAQDVVQPGASGGDP